MFASKPIALFFFFPFHSSSKLFFLVFPTWTTSTLPAFSRLHSEFHERSFYSFISFRVDTTPLASVVSCAYAVLDEKEIRKRRRKKTEYFYCGLHWLSFFIKMLAACCVVRASDEIGCWLKHLFRKPAANFVCNKLQRTHIYKPLNLFLVARSNDDGSSSFKGSSRASCFHEYICFYTQTFF